jgi:hypothetical protein
LFAADFEMFGHVGTTRMTDFTCPPFFAPAFKLLQKGAKQLQKSAKFRKESEKRQKRVFPPPETEAHFLGRLYKGARSGPFAIGHSTHTHKAHT